MEWKKYKDNLKIIPTEEPFTNAKKERVLNIEAVEANTDTIYRFTYYLNFRISDDFQFKRVAYKTKKMSCYQSLLISKELIEEAMKLLGKVRLRYVNEKQAIKNE